MTASTLPRWPGDAVPSFVLDQAVAIREQFPDSVVEILAPHDAGAERQASMHDIAIVRFRYFWPAKLQRLVYPAILPNIRRNPLLLLQVLPLLIAEFFAILSHARRFRATVIYSHWFMPQALAGSLAAYWLGIPHVFTTHSSDVEILKRVPWLGPALVRQVTRASRACTAVSSRTADRLLQFFTGRDLEMVEAKLRIIPMGVDVGALQSGAAQSGAAKAQLGFESLPLLLFIGRLTEKKGLSDLLAAAARLKAEGLDYRLVIAGDGELRASIAGQIAALGLSEQIVMPGFIGGEQKAAYLAAADILVVPSIVTRSGDVEGLPVALMEGMAAGKICVATDASGAGEVLTNDREGILVRAEDVKSLAAGLARALRMDAAQAAQFGRNAVERAADFDWPRIAQAHYRHLFADPDTLPNKASG